MEPEIDRLLSDVQMHPPYPKDVVEDIIRNFISEVGEIPYLDYLDFMRCHAGCDGPVGDQGYLTLLPLEEVVTGTIEAGVEDLAPGLLLFAGDGGNEVYVFDRSEQSWPIVSVSLEVLSRSELKYICKTFDGFIVKLANDDI